MIAILIGGAALIVLPVFSSRPFLRPAAAKKITALVALTAAVIGISAIAISLMGAANVLIKDPRVTYDPAK